MLSIIFSSRVKDNPDENIKGFLDSLYDCGGNKDNVEIILKYDDDDDEKPPQSFFDSYPFNIKVHQWSRGEGRHGIHLDKFYLFAQHDPKARFIMAGSDDFTFNRYGFIDDILSIDDEYAFIGYARPRMELYAPNWRDERVMNIWKHNEGVSLPCMTTKTLEVLQNWSWQSGEDNWSTLLVILMYANYGMDLWKTIPSFYFRNPTDGTSQYSEGFNNMEMGGNRNPKNPYYFDLVIQQAHNLYLNIKEAQES